MGLGTAAAGCGGLPAATAGMLCKGGDGADALGLAALFASSGADCLVSTGVTGLECGFASVTTELKLA